MGQGSLLLRRITRLLLLLLLLGTGIASWAPPWSSRIERERLELPSRGQW